MPTRQRVPPQNHLLAALPAKARETFLADCTMVTLALDTVLYEQGEPIRYVYFPIEAFISLLTTVDRKATLEVGMIGYEGMCGVTFAQGNDLAPLRGVVQGAGTTWQMKSTTFRRHLGSMPALRRIIDMYLCVLLRQLAQTVACTRFHVVEKRLARWLLMTRDRASSDSFDITQVFLAHMLGVRRVGVTQAAGKLQSRNLIRYTRGHMSILNPGRLEAAACECYRSDLETYRNGMDTSSKR